MLSGPNLIMNGPEWIVRINNILNEELEDEYEDVSASITIIPKPLISSKPECYIPQLIALGPYHHSREELHHMERYKLSVAKKIRTRLPKKDFMPIVDRFIEVEYQIRAHYQRYLPFDRSTLGWMMAIDASFLLEFLQTFSVPDHDSLIRIPSSNGQCLQSTRRTSTHDMVIRDMLMLENQIPLFLLLKILELQTKSSQIAREALTTMLTSFLSELTPFKKFTDFKSIQISSHSHLLELLYHSVVPSYKEELAEVNVVIDQPACPQKCTNLIKDFANTTKVFIRARTKAFMSLLIKFFIKIPYTIITSIPTFSALKLHVDNIILSSQIDPNMLSSAQIANQGPSFDEIAIPSVTELANVGIGFEPTKEDLSSVTFDAKTAILRLPEISLDVNSEVLLRNLVAYEAAIITGPLFLTRYVELMNGIIDTADDAKVLREKGLLVNRLRSDEEVAELWNGMSRSVRLTNVKVLDEVIEKVNAYHDGRWKVKLRKFVRKYVTSSWESLVVVFGVLLITMLGLQAFSTGLGLKFGNWAYRGIKRP